MSLISRYYAKQNIQNQLLEQNELDESVLEEDEVLSLCREVSFIKDNIMYVEDKATQVFNGFFGNTEYCQ